MEQHAADISKVENSMVAEETNEKKPLINAPVESPRLKSESSETNDNEPAYRNPDALESFADFYSRKRPDKKLKHKK